MIKIRDLEYYNNLKLDIYLPDSDTFDLLIYFHGGGLEGGGKEEIIPSSDYLVERNIAIISINYRLYPFAKYPDFILDAVKGIKWCIENINKYGECKDIYIGGTSAGAYITQMLCFNSYYYKKENIDPLKIKGYIHDAGQPTVHFNVLKEKGIDSRRIIVNEDAPLYYVGIEKEYPRMLFIVSTNDIENRYEQTMLMLRTLKHFNYDESKIKLKIMEGKHCEYVSKVIDNESVFGKIIYEFIKEKGTVVPIN